MQPDVTYDSPNQSARPDEDGILASIGHFTAGGDAKGSARWLCNSVSQASAHDLISRSAVHYRLVPYSQKAWHAGSRKTKPKLNGKTGLNSWSIGVELANWGPIFKAIKDEKVLWYTGKKDDNGEKIYETRWRKEGHLYVHMKNWTYSYTGPTPLECESLLSASLGNFPSDTVELWEPYPDVQIKKYVDLLKYQVELYGIGRDWVARHQDVDPTRKMDTGPALDWEKFLDQVFPQQTVQVSEVLISEKDDSESVTVEEMKTSMDSGRSQDSCGWFSR